MVVELGPLIQNDTKLLLLLTFQRGKYCLVFFVVVVYMFICLLYVAYEPSFTLHFILILNLLHFSVPPQFFLLLRFYTSEV